MRTGEKQQTPRKEHPRSQNFMGDFQSFTDTPEFPGWPRTSHLQRDHIPHPFPTPFTHKGTKGPEPEGRVWFWVPWGGKEKQGLALRPPDSSALEYFHFTLNEDVLETLIFSSWYSRKTRHHHSVPLEKTQRPQLLLTR